VTHPDDHEDLTMRGMLMDDDSTPARYSLTRPVETPPVDADEFDAQFAVMDDRAAHLEEGATSRGKGRGSLRRFGRHHPTRADDVQRRIRSHAA
jgi:hypothetical protein